MRCGKCKYYRQHETGENWRIYDEVCLRDGKETEAWYRSCRERTESEARMWELSRVQADPFTVIEEDGQKCRS